MKIGVVGSWYETVVLLELLQLQQVDIELYLDRAIWPSAMKSEELVANSMRKGVEYLLTQGVDYIIVPPVYESLVQHEKIIPLFKHYLHACVFPYSLVGKLWVLCNRSDKKLAIPCIKYHATSYVPSERQQQIRSFDTSFPSRIQEVSHWQLQLPFAGRREWMTDKLIKQDLRGLKDAAVDTLVPLDRSILYREKQINHRMGSKVRFHGKEKVRELLWSFFPVGESIPDTIPSCRLHVTASPDALLASKPRRWMLQQGMRREVEIVLLPN